MKTLNHKDSIYLFREHFKFIKFCKFIKIDPEKMLIRVDKLLKSRK